MSSTAGDQLLERRIAELSAGDPQFVAARPIEVVAATIRQPGIRLAEIIDTVLRGYADRPAIGQRVVDFIEDPGTGRTTLRMAFRFETITYRELADRISALSNAWAHDGVSVGERIATLGFNGLDYATIDVTATSIGAVSVPLQINVGIDQLGPTVLETAPRVITSSVDYLSDAVKLILTRHVPVRLVVFDYRPQVDDHREAMQAARARLAHTPVIVETLTDVLERGKKLPPMSPAGTDEDNPLALLIHTSGSTGTPKPVMYTQNMVATMWRRSSGNWFGPSPASITLNFMPMSHAMGHEVLYSTLGNGGTVYSGAASDLSMLLEDLALVRPTELNFLVPRVWDMMFHEFQAEVHRRASHGSDRVATQAQVLAEMRQNLLGGRYISAITGSAPISEGRKAWVESLLGMQLIVGYGTTETGKICLDGVVQHPPVLDYKLVDVPDLGCCSTDQPYPRGELLLKIADRFPGYYKRAELTASAFDADGYYRTGDIVAEVGPDRLRYLDRRKNMLKLDHGGLVRLAKLESVFSTSPLVRQFYPYGDSAYPYLLAVVVPAQEAMSRFHAAELKRHIADSLQEVAKEADLQSHEIPRDFIIEPTPFTLENGLLTGIRKLAWPRLKEHYGQRLEQLYAALDQSRAGDRDPR